MNDNTTDIKTEEAYQKKVELAFKNWVTDNLDSLDLNAAEIDVCEDAFYSAYLEGYEAGVAEQKKATDSAYWERNRLVALLARLYPSGRAITAIPGWDEAWHNCIYIDTPKGQLSWHVHDNEMVQFASLPEYKGEWDGHSTEEKYRRILLLILHLTALQAAKGE